MKTMLKKYAKYTPLFLFAFFMLGLSLLDALSPTKEFSPLENRFLTQYKAPTWSNLISGEFVENYQTFVNDQFVFREEWISMKSLGETLLLKTENNNIVYGKDQFMFSKVVEVDQTRMQSNTQFIKEFAARFPQSSIHFSLVPSASTIYNDYLPTGLMMPDQTQLIEDVYTQLQAPNLTTVDVEQALLLARHKEEEEDILYYRTDHHWTHTGAAAAFKSFEATLPSASTAVSIPPPPLEEVDGFYGTHYSKAKKIGTKPDTIYYRPLNIESITVDGEIKETLHNMAQFTQRDKYAGLLWGNNGVTVINGLGYREKQNPTSILIVKDSYGNSLAPEFLQLYDQVVMVDLRYIADIEELLAATTFTHIYIVYSFPNFTTDANIIKLIPEESTL